jgi:hypothetical protein
MTTRKRPPEHADMRRPVDRRFSIAQPTKLRVWLVFNGDLTPFAEIHLNERGSRTRSPRLVEACALLVMAGEAYDFVEAIARLADLTVPAEETLTVLVAKAREIVQKKESFTP